MKLWEAKEKFTSWKQVKQGSSETIRSYDSDLRGLCLYLRNPNVEDIGLDHILDYFRDMKSYGLKPNALARKGNAFKTFFEFCKVMQWKVIDPVLIPVARAKRDKIPRVAEHGNYQTLLNSIPSNGTYNIRNKTFINMLYDTGARNGEICSLNTRDLDLVKRKGIVITEKSRDDRPREIFWTEPTNDSLKVWIAERLKLNLDHDALFVSLSHNKSGRRIDVSVVGKTLRKLCKDAGLPTMNAHSFRHAMGHRINNNGGTNSDISNILGHASLAASYIYTQMNDLKLKSRYDKFMEGKE